MNKRPSFFSFAEARQPVNSWLCIAFISLLCFWIVLYYFTQSAEAVGQTFTLTIDPAKYLGM